MASTPAKSVADSSSSGHVIVKCKWCGCKCTASDPVNKKLMVRWYRTWKDNGAAQGKLCYYCHRAGLLKFFRKWPTKSLTRILREKPKVQRLPDRTRA